jgi:methyl-accepting chemotaxis protein
MKTRRLALRVTLNSALMLFSVYLVLQVITYFRDNIILGINDLSGLVPAVSSFMLSSVLPPMVVFAVLIYLTARPLERMQARLERGERLDEAAAEKVRRRIGGFAGLVLTVNLIGFVVGYVLSQVAGGKASQLLSPSGLVILFSNLAGAFSYARAQNALNSIAFADLRELLGIRSIGERKRELRSTLKQLALSATLALYTLLFIQFNMRDVTVAQDADTRLLARIQSGELSTADAAAEYRAALKASSADFSNRAGLDVESVPLPWERKDTAEDRQRAIFLMYALFIFAIVGGIQAACSLDQRGQIGALQDRLREVISGGGDLKKRLNLRSTDDIGELTELVNRLLDQFESVVSRIGAAAAQTGESAEAIEGELDRADATVAASEESFRTFQEDLERQAAEAERLLGVLESFAAASRGVTEAAERQREYVTESSSAMAEMAASIESVEGMTGTAGRLTAELSDRGDAGGASVEETSRAIDEIRVASEGVLGVVGALNKISASTNLLAMNASIEAAHAGDLGRGFAVVADEVRALAGDAAAQNRRIRELIAEMRDRVAKGVDAAGASGGVMKELVGGLKNAAAVSTEVAAAMREQAAGTRSAADSLEKIVSAAADIRKRTEEQEERSRAMDAALRKTVERIAALVSESRRQAASVAALRESFGAVRQQVDRNTAAARDLSEEISRFN